MARSKLSGSLLARKDAPSIGAASEQSAPAPPTQSGAGEGRGDKLVALTVKVDQGRYEALKAVGARTRRTNQQILLAALDLYLRGASGDGT